MRPRRLYIDSEHKPYYLIQGKKVYIKVPKKISLKQLQKVNIKNIINLPTVRRVKRRTGKKVKGIYSEKIVKNMTKGTDIPSIDNTYNLPTYLFQEQKDIPELAKAGRKPELQLIPGTVNMKQIANQPVIPMATLTNEKPALPMALLLTNEPTNPEITTPKKNLQTEFESPISKPKSKPKIKPVITGENAKLLIKKFLDTNEGNDNSKTSYAKFLKWRETPSILNLKLKNFIVGDKQPPSYEQYKNFFAKGGGNDDGLYNTELEVIAKKRMKHFIPCIASNQTNDLLKYVKKGDKEFGFIINTNTSTSDGSGLDGYPPGHWTVVYFDNRDDFPSAEFFDPLVQGKIPNAVVKIMHKIAKKMNPEVLFKYKQNMIRRQNFMSSHCGQFCIQFLENRMNGMTFSESSGYDSYMEKHKGIDYSSEGEEELKPLLKKYQSYI